MKATRLCALFLVAACAAPASNSPTPPLPPPGWVRETLRLPPEFAPDLALGVESLIFAPGFRDPASDEYWTYAFAVWMDESLPDAAALDRWLETYYDGLISAVAAAQGTEVEDEPADVRVECIAPDLFDATIRLIDAFGTFEPLTLHLVVTCASTDSATMRIRASPQRKEHKIWHSLEAAAASLERP
ncbi:MAG: hypothetical protein IPN34_14950 [Planctomycetes bacterium]|nr:hypothetical protein [Planctomycetota bacterium]